MPSIVPRRLDCQLCLDAKIQRTQIVRPYKKHQQVGQNARAETFKLLADDRAAAQAQAQQVKASYVAVVATLRRECEERVRAKDDEVAALHVHTHVYTYFQAHV